MQTSQINNKRIAKNTLLLYIRTLFVMAITLYTSRVILQVLGVDDYGIYQVIGGFVVMFSVISSSLSASISRFITFEIGRNNTEKLAKIFATSLLIQIIIAVVIFIVAGILGVWFIDEYMQLPEGRSNAAQWVLLCSLITFCVNLLSVPYNACIIAHEHMKAFAYVGIIDVLLKLGACFLILVSPIDKLIFYSILLTIVATVIRFVYTYYCHRHFEESKAKLTFDKGIFKEMFGFAGWSFFTNTNSILNNHGVTMLVNVFFGVATNAARGIATQVENAVLQFVNNFTTAVNPQITKSYAAGDLVGMHSLVCRAAKFSYFAMLLISLPIICEAERILDLWLVTVPEHTVIFVQLSLVMGLCDCIGSSGYTACVATGKMKRYALIITPIGLLEFPLTWLFFAFGAPVVSTYYLYIVVKILVLIARLFLLKSLVGMSVTMYVRNVFVPVILTSIVSVLPVFIIMELMPSSLYRFFISLIVCVLTVSLAVLYIGMTKNERTLILEKTLKKIIKK